MQPPAGHSAQTRWEDINVPSFEIFSAHLNVFHYVNQVTCPRVCSTPSKCPQCSADVSGLISQCDEFRLLSEEKDRLFELVNILQTKYCFFSFF